VAVTLKCTFMDIFWSLLHVFPLNLIKRLNKGAM